MDDETGYYYYGARYYNPRVSLWLNVDPLVSYDPIMNTEHYINGQHNGGVLNSGNLNPYIYTYNNPIIYTDPNGKQTKAEVLNTLRRVSPVDNVMKGKEWMDYQEYGNCHSASYAQNTQVNNARPTYAPNQINMYIDNKRQKLSGKSTPKMEFLKGLNVLIDNLKQGKPVQIGVMYERQEGADHDASSFKGDNNNVATNHYINVVGMGVDESGRYYFSYIDNYVDPNDVPDKVARSKIATNRKENRFYIHLQEGNMYMYDNSKLPIEGTHHGRYGNIMYIVTEIRPNKK